MTTNVLNRWIWMVIALVWMGGFSFTASASRSGRDIIRRCPKCKKTVAQSTMLSGNTAGARYWTDGRMIAPMLPDEPWLVRCPHDGHLFWVEQGKKLGYYSERLAKKWPQTKALEDATLNDYYKMLQTRNLSRKKKKYLHLYILWLENDKRRESKKPVELSSQAKKSLETFSALLNKKNPSDRLFKAEIARELKQFDLCLQLLNYPFKKQFHQTVAIIRALAQKKDWMVREKM
jgi:hypothetical protein